MWETESIFQLRIWDYLPLAFPSIPMKRTQLVKVKGVPVTHQALSWGLETEFGVNMTKRRWRGRILSEALKLDSAQAWKQGQVCQRSAGKAS